VVNRIQIIQSAGEHGHFTPEAFDASIGKTVPLKVEGRGVGEAKLVAAEVADDGKSVRLTFDTTGTGNLLDPSDTSGYSFGFKAREGVEW
jgi:hypothetical protein